jgi:hypothetical protein
VYTSSAGGCSSEVGGIADGLVVRTSGDVDTSSTGGGGSDVGGIGDE